MMMAAHTRMYGIIISSAADSNYVSFSSPKPKAAATKSPSPPVKPIPGTYGWPVLGPLSDRLDYFWFHGSETFFRKRMDKYKSTVFRTNVPPSFPFFGADVNPNVIAVLDCRSFSHMFDMDIIEKRNILVGDFMPSVSFTGNTRVCAYLDPTEDTHAKVKSFAMDILKRSSNVWVSSLLSSLDTMWNTIDESVSTKGKASTLVPLQKFLFTFLTKSIIGADPEAAASPDIAKSGYAMLDAWLFLQIMPTQGIGILQPLEEIFLHSFPYPFLFVKGNYDKLADFVAQQGKEVVERAQVDFGLTRDETIHNLLFILGFNAFGGFSVFFPTLLSILLKDSEGVQRKLREEVRSGTSTLSFESVKQMPLLQSFVYEALRLNPPVPIQYGRARKDFQLRSHESAFEVKKGELLCGYQKLVMRDPKVFEDPETFLSDRFTGEKGEDLLNYLYWSNGPQTGSATPSNKQCAAKDVVPLTACLFVAYLLRRYDSIASDSSGDITVAVRGA
ncbi:hypothetical protein Dimus_009695 [Dionaea muscipula]